MRINFIFDKTKKSLNFKKKILKFFKNYPAKKADYFVVAGGDGFMLKIIKKNYKFKKPFYGVNCGSYGFLMNKLEVKKLSSKIKKARKIIINPIKILAKDQKNNNHKIFAINEISVFRQSRQTANVLIKENKKIIIKKLIGDGVLVSTPAGSTAYNFSANGPILSLKSGKLALTPISPFRPRKWKGKIISNKAKIFIKNLNPIKRPLALVADNIEKRNITNLTVENNKRINISLLYDSSTSLIKKIYKEQTRV